MKPRSRVRVIAGLLAAAVLVTAGGLFAWLSPSDTLSLAASTGNGGVLPAIATTRAKFWTACPRDSFHPNSPLGTVAAVMDTSSEDAGASLGSIGRSMIQAGCPVDAYDRLGLTALHAAVLYGSPSAVRLLLDLGADPHQPITSPAHATGFAAEIRGMDAVQFAQTMATKPVGPRGDRAGVLALLRDR